MWKQALRLFHDNSELRDYMSRTSALQSSQARRAAVKIGVIDDQPFAPQANLLSYGYSISPVGDIKHLSEVAPFHMVLCDIMGVGKHFDPSLQGASIIAEVKKTYPEKVVVAYTGAAMNERAARIANARADRIIKKDISLEEWTQNLDELAADSVNPYVIWLKLRRRFMELEVRTRDILALEDAYVRSVLANDARFGILIDRAAMLGIGQDVRAILQGLASSMIFAAIFPH